MVPPQASASAFQFAAAAPTSASMETENVPPARVAPPMSDTFINIDMSSERKSRFRPNSTRATFDQMFNPLKKRKPTLEERNRAFQSSNAEKRGDFVTKKRNV